MSNIWDWDNEDYHDRFPHINECPTCNFDIQEELNEYYEEHTDTKSFQSNCPNCGSTLVVEVKLEPAFYTKLINKEKRKFGE